MRVVFKYNSRMLRSFIMTKRRYLGLCIILVLTAMLVFVSCKSSDSGQKSDTGDSPKATVSEEKKDEKAEDKKADDKKDDKKKDQKDKKDSDSKAKEDSSKEDSSETSKANESKTAASNSSKPAAASSGSSNNSASNKPAAKPAAKPSGGQSKPAKKTKKVWVEPVYETRTVTLETGTRTCGGRNNGVLGTCNMTWHGTESDTYNQWYAHWQAYVKRRTAEEAAQGKTYVCDHIHDDSRFVHDTKTEQVLVKEGYWKEVTE